MRSASRLPKKEKKLIKISLLALYIVQLKHLFWVEGYLDVSYYSSVFGLIP